MATRREQGAVGTVQLNMGRASAAFLGILDELIQRTGESPEARRVLLAKLKTFAMRDVKRRIQDLGG